MPDLYDMGNVIEKGYEVANKVQRMINQPPLDEVSYVMGFVCCFGILTHRVDIGLPADAPLDRIFDNIHRDVDAVMKRIVKNQKLQDMARDHINGSGREG